MAHTLTDNKLTLRPDKGKKPNAKDVEVVLEADHVVIGGVRLEAEDLHALVDIMERRYTNRAPRGQPVGLSFERRKGGKG